MAGSGRARRALPILLLLVALAPGARAQPGCEAPGLLLPEGVFVLDPGGRVTLDVLVENVNPVGVTVHLNVTAPKGWRAVLDAERLGLGPRTPAAANATVRKLAVESPERGAGLAAGEIIVTARAECTQPAGLLSPGAAASVAVRLADPPAPSLFLGMAGVLAGAVFVAVWRVRRTRPLVRLEALDAARDVEPGKGVSFPLRLENVRSRPDVVALRLEGIPRGWSAFLPLAEAALEPGESKDLWLLVRPPPYVSAGAVVTITVRAIPRHAAPIPPVRVTARVPAA